MPLLASIKKSLGLTQYDETVGSISELAGLRVPMNFLPCDGRALPISGNNPYIMLYSIIGNRFGGDGVSTFNLPDLRPKDAAGNPKVVDPWKNIPMKLICYQGLYPQCD